MLTHVTWVHLSFLGAAIVLEVLSDVLIKLSDGFRHRAFGFGGLVLIALAFACLGRAVEAIPLAVAYAVWGGFGLVAILLVGRTVFRQRLARGAWIGVVLVLAGAVLLHFA
jgi:spermidine export protein MdtI